MVRDHDLERRKASGAELRKRLQEEGRIPPDEPEEEDDGRPPVISYSAAKGWLHEARGRIVAGIVAPLVLGILYWVGGRAVVLKAATVRVYETPARVDRLEQWQASLPSPKPTITEDKADRLIKLLEAEATARQKGTP